LVGKPSLKIVRTSLYLIALSLTLVPAMTSDSTPAPSSFSIPATTVPTIAVTEPSIKMHVPPWNSYQEEDDGDHAQIPKHDPRASNRWTISSLRGVITPSPLSTPLQTPNPSRSASPIGRTSLDSEHTAIEDRQTDGKGVVMK
jgi:hypothetical protein